MIARIVASCLFAGTIGLAAAPEPPGTAEAKSEAESEAKSEAKSEAESDVTRTPESGDTEAEPQPAVEDAAPAGRPVMDRVLPCGIRVLIGRDDSLPVASVILALERGSEDDPDDLPGLHHALAYQLLMGNRDLAPGAIQAIVQDAGGMAFLATGPAQIRFEALIPVTVLDDVIDAEARRFRAPTVTQSLWKEALVSARRDVPLRRSTPQQAAAVAHGAPGLAHPTRVVPTALRELEVEAIEALLARTARYESATLVVVAPLPLEDTLAKVEAAFEGLPERARAVPPRTMTPSASTVSLPKARGNTYVWAVPGEPASRLWAEAWCEAISRQRRTKGEPKPNRLRCVYDDDPRRPTLTVQVRTPEDADALLKARFAALAAAPKRLLQGPQRRLTRTLEQETSTPLGLARRLAAAPASAGTTTAQSVESLTGGAALEGAPPDLQTLLPMERVVRIVPATPPGEQPVRTQGSSTQAEGTSP